MELGKPVNIIWTCIAGSNWDDLCINTNAPIHLKAVVGLRLSMRRLENGLFDLISDQFEEIK